MHSIHFILLTYLTALSVQETNYIINKFSPSLDRIHNFVSLRLLFKFSNSNCTSHRSDLKSGPVLMQRHI